MKRSHDKSCANSNRTNWKNSRTWSNEYESRESQVEVSYTIKQVQWYPCHFQKIQLLQLEHSSTRNKFCKGLYVTYLGFIFIHFSEQMIIVQIFFRIIYLKHFVMEKSMNGLVQIMKWFLLIFDCQYFWVCLDLCHL